MSERERVSGGSQCSVHANSVSERERVSGGSQCSVHVNRARASRLLVRRGRPNVTGRLLPAKKARFRPSHPFDHDEPGPPRSSSRAVVMAVGSHRRQGPVPLQAFRGMVLDPCEGIRSRRLGVCVLRG